jgi:hypothetical protein
MASTGNIVPRSELRYTERFSKERLSDFRRMGDEVADRVAAEIHEHHGGLTNIHDLLSTVQEKAELEGPQGEVFREFLSKSAEIPAWANRKKIERGQKLHAVTYPAQGLSLFAGSLVGGAQFSTASVLLHSLLTCSK